MEKDIGLRFDRKFAPYHLFAPVYDLLVKQQYSGEYAFTAALTDYYKEDDYETMVERAAIISRLEQMDIVLRLSGNNWGDKLMFKLQSMNTSELKRLIYADKRSHDDKYFDDQFSKGRLPRIFDRDIGFDAHAFKL